ncbi:class I SAM-dependent methyltransferase [Kangiella marina]|uniref:class I SAM-dependent methyltransferase n=1 Tax=Kangiella marina TaxID=1079178 RepID=UPI0031EE56EF
MEKNENVWTRYWSKGVINSCFYDDPSGNYGGEIKNFWVSVVERLSDKASMLDLCTGNGALISLVMSLEQSEGFDKYVGVDLASIQPIWLDKVEAEAKSKIKMLGNTAIEELPVSDSEFSLVVSQFGVEYCEIEGVIHQVERVLKNNGVFAAVIHHKESLIVKNAVEEKAHLDYLLTSETVKSTIEIMLGYMAKLKNKQNLKKIQADADANKAKLQFNSQVDELTKRAKASHCPDVIYELLDIVMLSFKAAQNEGLKFAKGTINNFWSELRDSRVRLENLINASLTESEIQNLIDKLHSNGLSEGSVVKLKESNQLLAWGLSAKKVKK